MTQEELADLRAQYVHVSGEESAVYLKHIRKLLDHIDAVPQFYELKHRDRSERAQADAVETLVGSLSKQVIEAQQRATTAARQRDTARAALKKALTVLLGDANFTKALHLEIDDALREELKRDD